MEEALGMNPRLTLFLIAVAHVYFAVCLQVIGSKVGAQSLWMAWIPIINMYLLCKITGKPGWWILLFFVPLVGIVINVVVWMALAEVRGKPSWVGLLMLIPLVGIFIPGYLAFSK